MLTEYPLNTKNAEKLTIYETIHKSQFHARNKIRAKALF